FASESIRVIRSTNRGATWAAVDVPFDSSFTRPPVFRTLAVHPTVAGRAIAAGGIVTYVCTAFEQCGDETTPVVISSDDRFDTWSRETGVETGIPSSTALAFDPRRPNILY